MYDAGRIRTWVIDNIFSVGAMYLEFEDWSGEVISAVKDVFWNWSEWTDV